MNSGTHDINPVAAQNGAPGMNKRGCCRPDTGRFVVLREPIEPQARSGCIRDDPNPVCSAQPSGMAKPGPVGNRATPPAFTRCLRAQGCHAGVASSRCLSRWRGSAAAFAFRKGRLRAWMGIDCSKTLPWCGRIPSCGNGRCRGGCGRSDTGSVPSSRPCLRFSRNCRAAPGRPCRLAG